MEVFCLQGAPSFNQITEEDLRCYWGTIRNFDLNRTDFLKFDPARLETIQLSILDREEKFTNTVVYIPMLATSGLDTKGNIIPLLTTSIISYLAGIVLIPRTYLFLSPGLLLQSTRLNPQEEPNSAQLQNFLQIFFSTHFLIKNYFNQINLTNFFYQSIFISKNFFL